MTVLLPSRRWFMLPVFFFIIGSLLAQRPRPEDFSIAGDTYRTGDNCYRLTEDYQWSSGSIWHRTPIDLAAPFSMELDLVLGCKDEAGADGMVFVFTPSRGRLGYQGEGMGFAGLVPSLGIEIDTWENEHLGDPPADHVAVLVNGRVDHFANLAGPVGIPNVEDCRPHRVRVDWQPARRNLQIHIDGRQVLAVTHDLVGEVFRGNTGVYWGVTSATGRYSNRQEICFEKLTFLPALDNLTFDAAIARRLLGGDILPLAGLQYATGGSDLQPASFPDLERLANLMKKHPRMTLEIFGHTDAQGDAGANLALSQRRADAVAAYLRRKGISADRIIARGFGERYPVASNATAAGRLKNRRVEIRLTRPVP